MGHKKLKSRKVKDKRTTGTTHTDVALADFADASIPPASGRVRKSIANLPLNTLITGPVIDEHEDDDDVENRVLARKIAALDDHSGDSESNNGSQGLILSDDIWIMLSEYMRPQDVLTFSLICKSSYRIVNRPVFWIKLYKRYYTKKVYLPTFLKKHCLERHLGLKQKVIRSLFYTYPPFFQSLRKTKTTMRNLLGHRCDLWWVRASEEEVTFIDQGTSIPKIWIYSFMLSNKLDESRLRKQSMKNLSEEQTINYNPDETCRLLEVISDQYTPVVRPVVASHQYGPKCINGMKLRKVNVEGHCIQLKFSSAPLSRFGTDYDSIDLYLHAIQPPAIYGWWHPHYYNQLY